ncbi:pyrophosphate--fructose 6-phosphate 1-phosphotransferase subunit beta 1 [Iris pallida]|uniref:Pyrophosphate--fructose 6-phosphate 1-phosphotransferase subunit beta 1 n=1 Tax=Iris pallida TaxID=29817 RepID=A0AAX6HSU7_IRIPA|nr:pyrophosphate--fructose 6-phosphate 1-phosphotransferase subunit beta 1 [Iris pallida]
MEAEWRAGIELWRKIRRMWTLVPLSKRLRNLKDYCLICLEPATTAAAMSNAVRLLLITKEEMFEKKPQN